MFKSQKPIIFTILLALLGIGATVGLGVTLSVRNSLTPENSSAITPTLPVDTYSGRLTCTTINGTIYTKKSFGNGMKLELRKVDEANPDIYSEPTPHIYNNPTVNSDGTYSIGGFAPADFNYAQIKLQDEAMGNATNCSKFEKLLTSTGQPACLNTDPAKVPNLDCRFMTYTCKTNKVDDKFVGFDFAMNDCPEPVLDLSTTAINTSTTISKNTSDKLVMYFKGQELSDITTLNTTYYFGEQGLKDIFSSYKVYICDNLNDNSCNTLAEKSPLFDDDPLINGWWLIAFGKDKKIKIEGTLLSTPVSNKEIKIRYAVYTDLPINPQDGNSANDIWTGNVTIMAPVVVSSTTTTSVSSSTSSVVTSISTSSASTSSTSSTRTTSGTVTSDSSSTARTMPTVSSLSSTSTNINTSSSSASSIIPVVTPTTKTTVDNTPILLALLAFLLLIVFGLFFIYKKYRGGIKQVPETPAL